MGLIHAALGTASGVLADQWKEYFYCEALDNNTLAVKGRKKTSGRSSNHGNDNIITSGSVIAVADGQCMLIVEQGKIVDVCAEPGEYQYDASTEPSVFAGNLGESILEVFKVVGKRFTFGGEAPKDQRIYYFNTKEIPGNKYGTPSPVPFRVVDPNVGLDIDISIRCFGEYSFRLSNPLLFYTNVCGNVTSDYNVDQISGQMRTELLTALQPAFARISEKGIRYSALPAHTTELADALNQELDAKWSEVRGMEIVSVGVSSVKASEEDEAMIKELQRNAAFKNPNMAAAHLVGARLLRCSLPPPMRTAPPWASSAWAWPRMPAALMPSRCIRWARRPLPRPPRPIPGPARAAASLPPANSVPTAAPKSPRRRPAGPARAAAR